MNSNKIKGDKAEREACALLTEFTGYEVERRLVQVWKMIRVI